MARIRSPNYPAISLAEAIKRIEQLHARERQHPAARDVILKGMGYGGVHGTSLGALSAAIKYGLLEQKGKGEDYRISDRAVAILHPHNPQEKAEALRAAARAPALFGELLDHFKGDIFSDDNLRAYLVRRGFSQTSLPGVIQAFRDTMELVTPVDKAYPIGGAVERDEALPVSIKKTYRSPPAGASGEPGMSQSTVSIQDERVELSAVLYDQEGVQKVIDRLTAVKSLLPEKPRASEPSAASEGK
jgi:hypothetical protein